MTVRRHRRYSTEFKIQLVQAYLDGEGSVRKIATRHGVPHSLLAIWIRKYEAGELAEAAQRQSHGILSFRGDQDHEDGLRAARGTRERISLIGVPEPYSGVTPCGARH